MKTLVRSIAAVLAVATTLATASAQEFRVFTVVKDLAGPGEPVRSLTLFHAGKVYDYLDVAGEVIIYEPAQQRFRLLKPSQGIVTTVAFDEIKQLLKIAREETEEQAVELDRRTDPDAVQAAAFLRFQLAPRFQESFDETTGTLTLEGGPFRYEVRTTDPGRPEVTKEYLEYADWVCRLNYLLHPAVLPESRLSLNRSLGARGRMPASVEQRVAITPALHGRAEHTIHFDLNAEDKRLIHQWESQLQAETIREVPRREYQKRTTLAAKTR
jgi:hypothetical protein